MVREPCQKIVSGYLFHRRCGESWACERHLPITAMCVGAGQPGDADPAFVANHPIPTDTRQIYCNAKELLLEAAGVDMGAVGLGGAHKALPELAGLELEAVYWHSDMKDMLLAMNTTKDDPRGRSLNVDLGSLAADFDYEVSRILSHARVPSAAAPALLAQLQRFKLGSGSRAIAEHATKGDTSREDRNRLLELCRSSPLIPATLSGLAFNP